MASSNISRKRHRQLSEGEPKIKCPKLESPANGSLSRFLEIPIVVKNLTQFLPLKDQISLLQTSRDWRQALKLSLMHLKSVSYHELFFAFNWPRTILSKAAGRRQIFSKLIYWLLQNAPNLAELLDLTWCLRAEDPLLLKHLQELETFQSLTKIHMTSGTIQEHHLSQFLSVVGPQLKSLTMKGRLRQRVALADRTKIDSPATRSKIANFPACFSFLSNVVYLELSSDFLSLVKDLPNLEILEILKCKCWYSNAGVNLVAIWSRFLPLCRRLKQLQIPMPYVNWDDFWTQQETPVLEHLSSLKTTMEPLYKGANDKALTSVFSKFPNLAHLEVLNTEDVDSLRRNLSRISQLCPKLTSLAVSDVYIPVVSSGFFLPEKMDLQEFRLESIRLAYPWSLGCLQSYSNLRVLELRGCTVRCQWPPSERGFSKFPNITQLTLANVSLLGLNRAEFAHLLISGLSKTCTSLSLHVKVGFRREQLRDREWTAILSSRGAQFKELGIGDSEISALTLNKICTSCSGLDRLQLMHLKGNMLYLVLKILPQLVRSRPGIQVFHDQVDLRADSLMRADRP